MARTKASSKTAIKKDVKNFVNPEDKQHLESHGNGDTMWDGLLDALAKQISDLYNYIDAREQVLQAEIEALQARIEDLEAANGG